MLDRGREAHNVLNIRLSITLDDANEAAESLRNRAYGHAIDNNTRAQYALHNGSHLLK